MNYQDSPNIILINEKIDPDKKNINELIKKNNIKQINLLSIDVDGRDLSIWKRLLKISTPNRIYGWIDSSYFKGVSIYMRKTF